MTRATAAIRNHPNYNPDDCAYLYAKGYSETEILAFWDRDRAWGHGSCRWDGPDARQARQHRRAAADEAGRGVRMGMTIGKHGYCSDFSTLSIPMERI